ncbi:MAG: helix-turn-helix domain-containing protein [Ruminococcus flavefaciens]|nr:helix-turn-helix domain-containing protein [Ruminococcus flavefaciens]
MVAEKIKTLRMSNNLTQNDIAKRLGITRSSVNAWEMGISVPSTMYIVELARLFSVSTDYILGLEHRAVLDISGLDGESVRILNDMVQYMRERQR